ncbi:MAG TPA: hemerythrin domain-containing protein [Candidatus Dormibacteraeota bacterium]|nr:hemerythrin domain-containing protein [Candidatus Dormibacteraeota bacterium]
MKATDMLKRQHREVEGLFAQVKKAKHGSQRRTLVDEIGEKLRAHMMIEETIFYPAVAEEVTTKKVKEMVPEAYEEHHVVQLVLDELPDVDFEDERFEAKMTVLEELIQHHVGEEEETMFPAAEKALGAEALTELAEQMRAAIPGDDGEGRQEAAHARH